MVYAGPRNGLGKISRASEPAADSVCFEFGLSLHSIQGYFILTKVLGTYHHTHCRNPNHCICPQQILSYIWNCVDSMDGSNMVAKTSQDVSVACFLCGYPRDHLGIHFYSKTGCPHSGFWSLCL